MKQRGEAIQRDDPHASCHDACIAGGLCSTTAAQHSDTQRDDAMRTHDERGGRGTVIADRAWLCGQAQSAAPRSSSRQRQKRVQDDTRDDHVRQHCAAPRESPLHSAARHDGDDSMRSSQSPVRTMGEDRSEPRGAHGAKGRATISVRAAIERISRPAIVMHKGDDRWLWRDGRLLVLRPPWLLLCGDRRDERAGSALASWSAESRRR